MKRDKGRYANNLAFIDFLFNYTIAFSFLFIVAFMMIRPPSNTEANVKAKAEFIITMTWPDEAFDDIDLWVELPGGEKVWYNHKNAAIATLDRDDIGARGDVYKLNPSDPTDERKGLVKLNREVTTIRACVAGRYIVAAHAYAVYDEVETFKATVKMPYQAKIEILKINPRVQTVVISEVTLDTRGQGATFVAFTIDENCEVTNIEQHPDDAIIDLKAAGAGAVPNSVPYFPGDTK
jgi:hypothetical protein